MPRWLVHPCWAAVVWIVVFWRFGSTSLMDPDEAHYAQLTREMLHSGSWLVPLLDGLPYIDKPVLFHWLQGAAFAVFGESEFAARLPSALAAIGLFATTRWAGIALLGKPAGEWGAVMFAAIPATFALASIALLDIVYTSFLFGAIGCLLVATREPRPVTERVGYGLLALAVMTKGPVALLLTGLFLGTAWLAGGEMRARVQRLHWKAGLVLAALVASPWFVWMYARFGDQFVHAYVLAGNLHYFTQPESFSGRAISHAYYARVFAGAFFPWSAVIVGRAADLALSRRSRQGLGTDEKLLWLWAMIVIGFFSLARFKLDHYIFPAAPALCLIAARAWHEAALGEGSEGRGTRWMVITVGCALVAGGTFASLALFELDLELPEAAILLPIALTLGGVAVLWAFAVVGWRLPPTPLVPVVTLLVIYALIVTIGFPTLERTRPTQLIATRLQQRTAPDAPSGIYRLEQWRSSLRYYAQRPLERLSTPEDLHAFVARGRPVYVFMIRRDYRALRGRGLHLREVFRCRAVVGTIKSRSGLRRQHWDDLILVTNAPRQFPPVWNP